MSIKDDLPLRIVVSIVVRFVVPLVPPFGVFFCNVSFVVGFFLIRLHL